MFKISVVLPYYNSEKYIEEAVRSIINQTLGDFEFIIINDGSTDRSSNIVRAFKDHRIIHIENDHNQGLIQALNTGLDLAQGEYVARMDSDDISLPHRFERQVNFLDANPNIGLVGTWMHWFPGNERQGEGRHGERIHYLDLLLKGWCVNHPTVMMRRSVLERFQLRYDERYPCAEDYELWTRFVRFSQIANLQEILVNYRWHGGNASLQRESLMQSSVVRAKQNMLEFLSDDPYVWKYLQSIDLARSHPG